MATHVNGFLWMHDRPLPNMDYKCLGGGGGGGLYINVKLGYISILLTIFRAVPSNQSDEVCVIDSYSCVPSISWYKETEPDSIWCCGR